MRKDGYMNIIKINCELSVKFSFNFPKNRFGELCDDDVWADVNELAEMVKKVLMDEYAVSQYGSVVVEMTTCSIER